MQRNQTIGETIEPDATRRSVQTIALVGVAFLLAAASLVAALPHGMGITPDSTQYLSVAGNLAAGNGLRLHWWNPGSEPLTHFPPGLPLALAGLMRLTGKPETAAFVVNLVALGTITVLSFALARRVAGGSIVAGVAAAFAIPLARDIQAVHAMVWSEGLFIALLLATLLAVLVAIETGVWSALVVAAVLAALASLTRYVGLALIGACAISLLVIGPGPRRGRPLRSLAFLLLACLPIGLLLLHNAATGTSATNRDLAFHPPGPEQFRAAARAIASWIIPVSAANWMEALLILTIAVTLTWFVLASREAARLTAPLRDGRARRAVTVLLIHSGVYLAFLVASITFADAQTTLNSRLLSPLLPGVLILMVAGLTTRMNHVTTRRPAVTAALALSVSAAVSLGAWIVAARRDGLGYNSVAWQHSRLVAAVAALPRNVVIYTNQPAPIAYHARRDVLGIPRHANPNSERPEPDFVARMRGVCVEARTRPVVYAHVFEANTEWFLPAIAEVRQHWHSRPALVVPEGVLDTVPRTCDFLAGETGPADSIAFDGSGAAASRERDVHPRRRVTDDRLHFVGKLSLRGT